MDINELLTDLREAAGDDLGQDPASKASKRAGGHTRSPGAKEAGYGVYAGAKQLKGKEGLGEAKLDHRERLYSDPSAAHEFAMRIKRKGAKTIQVKRKGSKQAVTWYEKPGEKLEEAKAGKKSEVLTPAGLIKFMKSQGKGFVISAFELTYAFNMRPQKVKAMLSKMVNQGQLKREYKHGHKEAQYTLVEETASLSSLMDDLRGSMSESGDAAEQKAHAVFAEWGKLNIYGTAAGGRAHLSAGGENLEYKIGDSQKATDVQKKALAILKKHGFTVKQGRRGWDAFHSDAKVLVKMSDVKRGPAGHFFRIWVYTPSERFYANHKKRVGF